MIVDVATRAVTIAAASGTSRCVSPAWMPDGRRVLFASDRGGGPFRLFAVDLATRGLSRLEGTGSSAQSPDVSADGRAVVYVGYTPDGYDLFTLPLDAARWSQVENASTPAHRPDARRRRAAIPATTIIRGRRSRRATGRRRSARMAGRSSRAPPSAAPTPWAAMPTSPTSNGHRHERARTGACRTLYDRWRPVLFASASDDTDPFRAGEARSIELNAGVLFPWKRVRWAQSVLGGFHAATDTIVCPTCERPIDERAGAALDQERLRVHFREDATATRSASRTAGA